MTSFNVVSGKKWLVLYMLTVVMLLLSTITVLGQSSYDFEIDTSSNFSSVKIMQKSDKSEGILLLDCRSEEDKTVKVIIEPFEILSGDTLNMSQLDIPDNTDFANAFIWELSKIQPTAGKFIITAEDTKPSGFLPMGMNIGGIAYYFSRNLMFNDIMKTAADLKNISWGPYPEDHIADDGLPEGFDWADIGQLGATVLINNTYDGEYVFLYDGDGAFGFGESIEVLETKPNVIDLKLTEIPLENRGVSGQDHRHFNILYSNPDNRVRNIRIIPKKYEGNESSMPMFDEDFTNGLKDLNAIRYMDATVTNGSNQKNWSDRPTPDDFSYISKGLPIEFLIELSNELNIDAWFCVPHMASDDYIENMARLIKDELNENLKVYIEYSNEIWHRGFVQGNWVNNNAPDAVDGYVSSDLQALDGTGKYQGRSDHLKEAYMMSRVFRIFESVFEEESRDRLVTVGVTVTSVWIEYVKEMFEYWRNNGPFPDAIAMSGYFGYETSQWNEDAIPYEVLPRENASDLNDYFHKIWNSDPENVTGDHIIDAVNLLWDYTYEPGIVELSKVIKDTGAKLIVYEGGQHMQPHNQGNWDYNHAVYDAQISPRMYDLYMRNYRLYESIGCELFANFSYVGHRESQYGSWGVLENLRDINSENLKVVSPKYKALIDANLK